MLGADTRSTSDTTVADKNCEKIHFIAPNIYCCGAGTAADTENVTGTLCSVLLGSRGSLSRVRQTSKCTDVKLLLHASSLLRRRHGVLCAGAA